MNETIAILTHAYILIKKGWTRKFFARNSSSREVDVLSDKACRFCAIGAIRRATHDLYKHESTWFRRAKSNEAEHKFRQYAIDQGYKSSVQFNDINTKSTILAAIKHLIHQEKNAVKS